MLHTVKTFNARNINDGSSYKATLLNPHGNASAKPVYIDQAKADSQDAGTYTVDVQTKVLQIEIRNYANRYALIAQLKKWLKRGTQGNLVVTFSDDGVDYQMSCRAINLVQNADHPMYFTATLQTGNTSWKAVSPSTYTWNLTGTGGTYDLTLAGDDETPLSVTFTLAGAPASGYLYQRLYQLISRSYAPGLGFGPWCITMDTAALIADDANKCQINQVGGIDDEVTTIPYDTVTGTLPSIGSGYVGTEQITWTGKTGTTSGNLTGVTRGAGGTTAAAHADNAQIKLSYIQANCADVRVFVDGKETNRWIASPNNANTKIWFNVELQKGYGMYLREAFDDSTAIPYIYFASTDDTANMIATMPAEGIIQHGTEWIKYRKDTDPSRRHRLVVVERGVMGTTKQAHVIGDTFKYVEHAIVICYGNSAAVDPSTVDVTYDDTKPLFNLVSSTNDSWVYDATTLWYDAAQTGHTGGWDPVIIDRLGEVSTSYDVKQNAASGDPAMGMLIGSFLKATGWASEYGQITWMFYRACGINTTTFTGQKYRTHTTWPANVGLRASADGKAYSQIWNEATPASVTTWTALASHSGVAMGSVRWMRFMFNGNYPAAADSYAAFEILTGTIAFVTANLPVGTLFAQKTNAQLELELTNAANGDVLEVNNPMLLGLPLALDGEERTVLYNNVNAHNVIALNDEGRDWWIRLQPGSNSLTVLATDVGTLAAVLSWYRRRL